MVDKETKTERPGREIKIENELFGNDAITIRVGTAEDKNSPKTVYMVVTFWVDIKERDESESFDKDISKEYSRALKGLYKNELKDVLLNNAVFPFYYENIYIYDFPENLNYNSKRSFTSVEINLHTANCIKGNTLSLKNRDDNEMYNELIKLSKVVADTDLMRGRLNFTIHKSKNDK